MDQLRPLVDVGREAARLEAAPTSSRPQPPAPAGLDGPGVHVLRTRADAERLRAQLLPERRLVIVGAGFVGTEVASTARTLGLDVTLIDGGRLPLERILGADIGRFLARHYRAHDVDVRLETSVARLRRDGLGALRSVVLTDGAELPCDLLLVAVGAEPTSELLGLPAGVPTDETGRTALPGVYACGDVAAPWQPARAAHHRLEHWTSAAHQAAAVARTILGHETAAAPTPYFWSDQFGLKLQHIGAADAGWTRVVVEGNDRALEARLPQFVGIWGVFLARFWLDQAGSSGTRL